MMDMAERLEKEFQPTPSARRVTGEVSKRCNLPEISTHTLRKEGDWHVVCGFDVYINFNPHPPQGG